MRASFHEDRLVGLMLTFIGGAMDSYTYIHYDVFASAQTGNIVLMIIQAFDSQWESVIKKLLSTVFFCLGIFLAKFMIDHFRKKKIYSWRLFILYYEAFIFFLVSMNALNQHQTLVTLMISFTAAIQWITFDKINGLAYTNLFTTGNIKGFATNCYDFLKTREAVAFEKFVHYLSVVLSFIAGAIVSVFCYRLVGPKAILLVSVLFLILSIIETYLIWRFYRTEHFRKLQK